MEERTSLTVPLSPPKKKRRRAITDAEKKAIREHWAGLQNDQKSHKAVISWFEDTYYHTISQSTVSEILSIRYNRLDAYSIAEHPAQMRNILRYWPDFESALNEWQIWMVRKGASISKLLLQEMAGRLWDKLPQYSNSSELKPKFSGGWLDNFKARHHISQKLRHGEAANVNLHRNCVTAKLQMPIVCSLNLTLKIFELSSMNTLQTISTMLMKQAYFGKFYQTAFLHPSNYLEES
jgi:hypothetical protein